MREDSPASGMKVPGGSGGDLVEQLRSTLERAGELVRVLEANLRHWERSKGDLPSGDRVVELEERLERAEADVRELASQLVESEHQANRLMNLYVATYQLHSSLVPQEVQSSIAEIAVNLLGAERFLLLLLRAEPAEGCEIALKFGVGDDDPMYGGDSYAGGDPAVDATLMDGVLRQQSKGGEGALAAVPLRVQGEIVGALVLLKLLDHKPVLGSDDRDLLDLLSAHAASALFAARLFATKERKLKTLESLVKLARGE